MNKMTTTKIPTPKEYCAKYIETVYDEPDKLSVVQLTDVASAFHAGIEAACKFMQEHVADDDSIDEDEAVKRITKFRQINKARALHINLMFREPKNSDENQSAN